MSIIGTIRNKFTWLLISLLALAMLAFMLMDGTNGRGASLTGGNQTVGLVAGKKIKAADLQKKMLSLKELYPNANDEQLRNTAWNDLIDQQVFEPRFSDLGVDVTRDELKELITGDNPHQYARQMFSSLFPDGNYDKAIVQDFLKNSENRDQIYNQLQTAIGDARKNEKYSALLRNGVNVPQWMAEDEFVKEYKTVNFDYVMLPYTIVNDDEVTITDGDLRAYAEKHKEKYQSEEGYTLQYVSFEQVPSKADSTNQLLEMQKLKTALASSPNPEQFARNNTTVQIGPATGINPNVEFQTFATLNLKADEEDKIIAANEGDIVGPFENAGNAYITKVLEKTTIADSATVRHILIEGNPADPAMFAQAKVLADSLATELKKDKSKFEAYVTEYSSDQGSVANGGKYEMFPQGQMVPTFNTAAFNNKIGAIEVVESPFGYHIIEALDRKGSSTAVKLATIIQGFKASKQTLEDIYSKAKNFEKTSQSRENFIANATELGGVKTTPVTKPEANTITGLGEDYSIIRWANNSSPGAVKYFSNVNGNSVVARVDSKTEDGQLNIEANRAAITNEVRNEKKAAILNTRIDENGGASTDLQTLANSLGRQVQTATDAKFGASGTGVGYEPEVISSLFFKTTGQVNETLKGRRGVYVVNVNGYGELPPESNFDQYKTKFSTPMTQKANTSALVNQLIQRGVVKDERYKIR